MIHFLSWQSLPLFVSFLLLRLFSFPVLSSDPSLNPQVPLSLPIAQSQGLAFYLPINFKLGVGLVYVRIQGNQILEANI